MAQAPAKSLAVIMIGDTPSPVRTGRFSVLLASSEASTQSGLPLKRPGNSGRMKKDFVSTWSDGTGSSGGTLRLPRMSRSRSVAGLAEPAPMPLENWSRVSNRTVPPCCI